MTIQEIREICYTKYGCMSKMALDVLKQAINYKDIHKLCHATGVSFRMVKELVQEFGALDCDNYVLNEDVVECLKNFDITFDFEEEKEIDAIIKKFKFHNKNLDHVSATSYTLYLRVKYILNNIDVENCSILFLGDHDFTSVALAIYLKKLGYTCKNITVIDVDDNVLDFIYNCNNKYDLKINILHSDFRFGIPKCCNGGFDCVFSDPPYTPEGMGLFSKRALQCVKDKNSIILLCYKTAELSAGVGLKVQQELMRTHIYFRAILPNFNDYNAAEALGYKSDLYVCNVTTKAIEHAFQKTDEYEIYTHGKNSIEVVATKGESFNDIVIWLAEHLQCDKKILKFVSNEIIDGAECISFGKYYCQRSNKTPNLSKDKIVVFNFYNQAEEVLDLRFLLMTDKKNTFAIFKSSQTKILEEKKYNFIKTLYKTTEYKFGNKVLVKFSLKEDALNGINRIFLYTFASLKNAFVNVLTKLKSISQNQARGMFYDMNLMIPDSAYIFDLPCCTLNILANKLANLSEYKINNVILKFE